MITSHNLGVVMSPIPVPPPVPPPYAYVIPAQQHVAPAIPAQQHVAPHRPPPELRIRIADSNEAAQILNLPDLERDETIKGLADSCLSQLGGAPRHSQVSIRTETSHDGLFLVISFLGLGLLTVTKVAEATKDAMEAASVWAGFLTGLPAVGRLLRRAVGLRRPLIFNEPMLIGLTINYARSNGYGSGTPIDACLVEPWQLYLLDDPPMQANRDTFGILTCDELPRPQTLYAFVVTRTGGLLAQGMTVQLPGKRSPTYRQLHSAEIVMPKLDVSQSQKITAKLPSKSKDMRRSSLRMGIFSRTRGLIYVQPSEMAEIDIKKWPSAWMMAASAGTSLISAVTVVRQQRQRQARSREGER